MNSALEDRILREASLCKSDLLGTKVAAHFKAVDT
jgi:hypothetical protein